MANYLPQAFVNAEMITVVSILVTRQHPKG